MAILAAELEGDLRRSALSVSTTGTVPSLLVTFTTTVLAKTTTAT